MRPEARRLRLRVQVPRRPRPGDHAGQCPRVDPCEKTRQLRRQVQVQLGFAPNSKTRKNSTARHHAGHQYLQGREARLVYLYTEQLQAPQEPWLRLVTMSVTKEERSGGGCYTLVAAPPSITHTPAVDYGLGRSDARGGLARPGTTATTPLRRRDREQRVWALTSSLS